MDEIATKTLAEIYFKQGDFRKAYEIYKILAARDPSDIEIQKRLNQLDQELNLSRPSGQSLPRSKEEKIRFLERWLAHIEERKKE
jgi:hypothetical protein